MSLEVSRLPINPQAQCEFPSPAPHDTHIGTWRIRTYPSRNLDPAFCVRRAHYLVNGQRVCVQHAGSLLLADAMKRSS